MRMRLLGAGLVLVAATALAAPFAYFAGDTKIVVVDTATDTIVDDVDITDPASGITVSRDGRRVYVHGFEDAVQVLDATTNLLLPPLPLPEGDRGTLEVSPLGTAVYVNNNAAIVVKDPADPDAETVVPVGTDGPTGLALLPDGSRLYVSMFNVAEIKVLDTATNALLPSIPVAAIRGSLMALSPDGTRLYVPHRDAGFITIVDTTTNSVVDTIPSVGDELNAVVAHPDGTRLYATRLTAQPHVVEIDLASRTTTATIPTPEGAFAADILPDGSKLYVYGFEPTTTVVTTSTRTVATIPMPEAPSAFGRFIAPQACGDGVTTFPEACDDGNTSDGDCCAADCGTLVAEGTSCADDGNACTNDRCDAAGACAHPPQAGGACDDGDVCTSGDRCDGTGLCAGSPSGACLDDYLCYGAKRTKGSARPAAARGIALSDGIASRTLDAKMVTHACTPASGGTPFDAETHLAGWKVAKAGGGAGPKGVVVTDPVATTTLDLQRPQVLLVPSGFATTGAATPPGVHQLDTHLCWGVKATRGAAKPPRGLTRTVTGPLTAGARIFALKKPRLLCPAAAVAGAGARFPDRDLLCWGVKAVKGQAKPPRPTGASLASALGTATVDVGAELLLCLRATRS